MARGNIISYFEMCRVEGTSLQRGMNFRVRGHHSVILMSVRPGAPYRDRIQDEGQTLIYEGHDVPKSVDGPNPKIVDQPEFNANGRPTENGKFHKAAQDHKRGLKGPDLVRVYEKLRDGVWSDNGYFHLVDSWREADAQRQVFKFKLKAIEDVASELAEDATEFIRSPGRIIPAHVKQAVWKRDGGKCVTCGATDELHFDHILPFSKGGTSLTAENVQLLCARHNLKKRDRIE
ncbi:MAG: HNH endonuclease [Rhodospirillaceae bacterium]